MIREVLTLSHQSLLEKKFHELAIPVSEYSFANLYLFRELHRYEYVNHEEEVFIKGIMRDGSSFIMPTKPPTQLSIEYFQFMRSQADFLFPIPDQWISSLEKYLLRMSFKEEDSDYLYKISKLAKYPGRHLSKKRNLVKQLVNAHEIKVENLTSSYLSDAQQILDQWQSNQDLEAAKTDYLPCKEALCLIDVLKLLGRVVYVDEEPAGFILGEWLNEECFAVHFNKALHKHKGLYQFLFQDLAQALDHPDCWMNLEQDLGIPSIRDAKHSYLPDAVIPKWRVWLR